MSKHTPGPWIARGTTVWADAEKPPMGHEIIANTRTARGDEHDMSNANLIAAAPAMYEALKLARKKIEMWPEGGNPEYFPEIKAIDKALAQAEGNTK